MAQPFVPVLLYFYDWRWVLLGVFVVTLLWRVTVLQWFISVRLANIGALFVQLKFLTCPLMAVLIWRQGDHFGAVLALLWPLAGMVVVSGMLTIMLTRNIAGILNTYNPEIFFQIQLSARQSVIAANLPQLIANYRKTYPWPET